MERRKYTYFNARALILLRETDKETKTFSYVPDAFTIGGTCLFYSVMCLHSILFVFLFVPETRNKTLQQISQELKNT